MKSIEEYNEYYRRYMEALEKVNNGLDLEFVFGWGELKSSLMLIGEAPGKNEVLEGKPFVGPAGKVLSEFLGVVNLRREDLYITNSVKYRMSKVGPSGNLVNRPARIDEIERARGFLIEEIKIVNPKIIVTMGNVSLKSLLNRSASIGQYHGKLIKAKDIDPLIYPIYHPASLIYNSKLRDVYKEDLLKLKGIISKKGL